MQPVLGLALSLALAFPAGRTEAQASGTVARPPPGERDSEGAAQDAYRRAFQLMVERRWSEAAAAFREVVATPRGGSPSPRP